MSITSITGQQRYALATSIAISANHTQDFIDSAGPVRSDVAATITEKLDDMVDQLVIAGLTDAPLEDNQTVLSDGDSVSLLRSNNTATGITTTAEVSGGALTGTALPESSAVISQSALVTLRTNNGTLITGANQGTAQVVGSDLSSVRLGVNMGAVVAGNSITVRNSAGASVSTGTVSVSTGTNVVSAALPATAAVATNGQALTVPVTGIYTNTATITVANGVITGITLS